MRVCSSVRVCGPGHGLGGAEAGAGEGGGGGGYRCGLLRPWVFPQQSVLFGARGTSFSCVGACGSGDYLFVCWQLPTTRPLYSRRGRASLFRTSVLVLTERECVCVSVFVCRRTICLVSARCLACRMEVIGICRTARGKRAKVCRVAFCVCRGGGGGGGDARPLLSNGGGGGRGVPVGLPQDQAAHPPTQADPPTHPPRPPPTPPRRGGGVLVCCKHQLVTQKLCVFGQKNCVIQSLCRL